MKRRKLVEENEIALSSAVEAFKRSFFPTLRYFMERQGYDELPEAVDHRELRRVICKTSYEQVNGFADD